MDHVKIEEVEQLLRDMLSIIDSLNRIWILSEASLTPARRFSGTDCRAGARANAHDGGIPAA
ncbi:MAG: hypothetical protein ABSD11_19535 [Methylocella sp.]|jgi:hypothetical protein